MKPSTSQPTQSHFNKGKPLTASARNGDFKEHFLNNYHELKSKGESFFPFTVYKDAIAALILFCILLAMALFLEVPLEAQAAPLDGSYVPRPEWYFLSFFELLKHIPGKLEFVGALGAPLLILLALFFLPFYDRNPRRQAKYRPLAITLMIAVLLTLTGLSIKGASTPAPPTAGIPSTPGVQLSTLEAAGKRVYQEQRCFVCHQVNGEGGAIGPDLSTVGKKLTASWVLGHLEEPKILVPGSKMPDYAFSNEDMMGLTAYLLSLKEKRPLPPGSVVERTLSPQAEAGKAVYSVQCNACHPGGNTGIGPKLAGPEFDKRFKTDSDLAQIIRQGKGAMPGYSQQVVNDQQLSDMIEYMRSLKVTQ